ncbi:MAG: hypothetical protein ABW208_18715 [Pyrinomonadaceae bacterium]
MASLSAPEEIFRFSIVRNPEPASDEALQDSIIRILPHHAERTHQHYSSLLQLRRQGRPRTGIVDHAAKMMSAPKSLNQLESLNTPIFQFSKRLYASRDLSTTHVRSLVQDVFGEVVCDELENDRTIIADSLILASVAAPPVTGLRGRLMRALRAIEVIRRLADSCEPALDDRSINRLLNATLLLPSELFPIPDNKARAEENRKEHQRRKEQLERENVRAQGLLNQLARNAAAVEELSGTLSMHLFELRHLDGKEAPVAAHAAVLPQEKVERLSAASKKAVLEDVGVSAKAVDVPFVVEQLEKRSFRLGHDLTTNFGDLLLDASTFNLPGCGECKPVVLSEPKSENNFTPDTRGKVELVGIHDLLIVRQSLREYRAGEIAHIENVLVGERKAKKHRKLHRSEVTLVEEIEREEEVEDELQTTDKYELQTESSRVIQEDKSAEAGVTVTASYGTVNIEAHGNYAYSGSTTESRNSASSYARDVVSRSLQRIRERVLTRRSRTDISEVEVINEHEFDNKGGTDHVNGIYRWVDKVYEAQIVNYGKRTMLEFMIPDPAAFYRFAAANKPVPGATVARPEAPGFCRNGVFHPLAPGDLQPENYMCFVGKYKVSDVAPPTPRYIRLSDVVKFKVDSTSGNPAAFAEINDNFKVPGGYTPRAITYTISGGNTHSATTPSDDHHDDIILVVVTIGDRKVFRFYKSEIGKVGGEEHWEDITQVIEWGSRPLSPREQQFGGYAAGALSGSFPLDPATSSAQGDADVVKVSLTGHTTLPMSVSIHYTVLCERTQTKFQQWQIDTFNAIQGAYLGLKQEYDASLQAQEAVGLTNIQGRNPLLNREVEKRELKKFSISLLTGQQYESFNAMEEDYLSRLPQINLADAAAEGKFVRFFEQALEWRHMTYLFYPYFWANKKNWTTAVNQRDTDPLFEQFLQAGYARVWVPVRPGFDPVIASYIQSGGEPWTEKDSPLVEESGDSPPFVSLLEEIKEQLGADFEFRAGTLRVRNGDARVTGSGTDLREDDVDREILIALRYYRIAEVDAAAQTFRLGEPYGGEDGDALGFAIGVKFVGQPWLVQVPTTLVHLKASAELIIG